MNMEEDFLAPPPLMEEDSLASQSPLSETRWSYSNPMLGRKIAPPMVVVRTFVGQGKARKVENTPIHKIPQKTALALRCTDYHLTMCKIFDKEVPIEYIVVKFHGLNDDGLPLIQYLDWQRKTLKWLPFERMPFKHIVPIELYDCLVFNLGKDGRLSRIKHELLLNEIRSDCSKMNGVVDDDDELTADESEILDSPSEYSPKSSSESPDSSGSSMQSTKCNHCHEKEISLFFRCWVCNHGTCDACNVRCPELPVITNKYAYVAMRFNDPELNPLEIYPVGFLEKEDMHKYTRENGGAEKWCTYQVKLHEPARKRRIPRAVKSKYQVK